MINIKNVLGCLFCTVVICISISGCANKENDFADYERVSLDASWAYNYEDVDELTEFSDLIAEVTIEEMVMDEQYEQSGFLLTKYRAKVDELIFGDENEIEIIMTGGIDNEEKKIYEVEDDPLMTVGEEYLIFARKNEDGTYTILSGSQGRFVYKNDKVYSLNIAEEQVGRSNSYSNITVEGEDKTVFREKIEAALQAHNK